MEKDKKKLVEKKLNIFDFLNDLSWNKEYIFNEQNQKIYSPYMINKFLSMNRETLFYADELNAYPHLSKQDHFRFLFYALSKKKRFFKYIRPEKFDDVKYIKIYYNVSEHHALEYLKLLNDKQLEKIRLAVKDIVDKED